MRYYNVVKALLVTLVLLVTSCDDQEAVNNEVIQTKNKPQPKLLVSNEDAKAVITNYVNLANAIASDVVIAAQNLRQAIDEFIENPAPATQIKAKNAWQQARIPYLQYESLVNLQSSFLWKLNLDVGMDSMLFVANYNDWLNSAPNIALIDYVADLPEPFNRNIINADFPLEDGTLLTLEISDSKPNQIMTNLWGENAADLPTFTQLPNFGTTPKFKNSANDYKINKISGFHAIEFLLWGQDLYGNAPGAGMRLFTDYLTDENCTNGNCARRAQYLQMLAQALVTELKEARRLWQHLAENLAEQTVKPLEKLSVDHLIEKNNAQDLATKFAELDPLIALNDIYTSLSNFALDELAFNRLQTVLDKHNAQYEFDSFSNNTHNTLYFNVLGLKNLYLGQYQTIDGQNISGASLSSLVAQINPEVDLELRNRFDLALNALQIIVDNASNGQHFDQLIAKDNSYGNNIVQDAANSLIKLNVYIDKSARSIGLIDFGVPQ